MTYAPRKEDRERFENRHRATVPGTSICVSSHTHDRRYCECCGQYKPTNSAPHIKGWRCTDCKTKEKS